MLATQSPFPLYADLDGKPLEGFAFFGVANQNPETSPVQVYWDAAGTQPASQPIKISRGVTVRGGTPTVAFINGTYSQTVKNVQGATVFYAADSGTFSNAGLLQAQVDELRGDLASTATGEGGELVGFIAAGSGAQARNAQSKAREFASPADRGAAGTGSGNDGVALQAAVDYLSSVGGGVLHGCGLTYRSTAPLIIKDGVTFDLEGGKLLFALSGANDYGVRLRNYSHILNGEIEVQSSGSPGTQAGIHAPIMIGPFYGDGGTVGAPSVDEGVTGWSAQNLKISTNAVGKVGVQIMGGANNGVIKNIEVPDSSVMGGVIHLDWGFVGTIDSADIATSRSNFNAGTAYTTHPHNIEIENIKAGALARAKAGVDTGSHLLRLSGVYNIKARNLRAKQTTYAAVRTTAGDVGFEFAPAAIKPLRMKGISIRGVAVENTTDSWLVYADSYADNVASAVSGSGYSPLVDPLHETDLDVRQVTGKGSGGASVTPGLYLVQLRGGRFVDINASGYLHGALADEQVYDTEIHGTFTGNRGHGIYIHHGTFAPEDVRILPGTRAYQNGQDALFSNPAGIAIEKSVRARVDGALLGHRTAASETTQVFGLRVVSTDAVDVEVENCHAYSVKTSGSAYSLISSTAYGVMKVFRNNTANASITTKVAGANILPVNRFFGPDGVERGQYIASRSSLTSDTTPTAGTWAAGDVIEYSNPIAASFAGTRCVTGGTPGTWKRYGATEA